MKLVKITILSIIIIIVGIISISYVTTESNMIEEIEENPSEQISQLIEWDSDNLFKVWLILKISELLMVNQYL